VTIWVDADAAPREVKDVVFRAGRRLGLEVVLVANQRLSVPPAYASFVRVVAVSVRADEADRAIAERAAPADVVVTADVALAAAVVGRGAFALDPRGREWTADDVGVALRMRNLQEELRGAGVATRGPKPYGPRDLQAFAAALDRALARFPASRRRPPETPRT
jgi:uncharacterized protein YaiI (UPF0178 family)